MSTILPTRVFLSYSWDSEQHKDRVLALAQRLRGGGLDAWIDRFTPFPAQGWPRWMQDEINHAKFVLCIVTKTYAERFLGHTASGKGQGVNWEGSIITSDIYQNGGRNEKFIPIIFDLTDAENLPHPLRDYTNFHGANDYDALYRLLTNQPEIAPHPLGSIIPAPLSSTLLPLKQPKVYRHRHDRGNLPRLPYFFGRDHDLDTIAAALNPDTRTWLILIDGPGGIGKTSLAIRAAEIASETDYPRIVFVSSKARELEPDGVHAIHDFLVSSYPEILNAIARELGNTGFDKLSERNRPSALHTLLREKPALLVIDDLESLSEEDRTRILEFLKHLPTGTKAIVTSRRRTDVQAEALRLERISWDEAAQLLTELARNNKLLAATTKAKRRELYNHTGGNPLILRWVAGQLGRGQCRTVVSALEMLKQSPSGEQALEFIFGDLLDTFTRDEMELLAALTQSTQPVLVEHLAQLSGVSPLTAQPALENLADRALVIGDAELRRFVLTPLVADFLRSSGRAAVRAAMQRHLLKTETLGGSKQLQEAYSELQNLKIEEQIAKTRGDIYASIIHDINGPLTVISSFTHVLNEHLNRTSRLEKNDLEFIKDRLRIIARQVGNCVEISRRYLGFLRRQTGEAPRVSVNQLFKDLEQLIRVHPSRGDNEFSVQPVAEDLGVKMNGTDFIQILLNLTVNAFQCASMSHRVDVGGEILREPIDLTKFKDGPNDRLLNVEGMDNTPPLVKLWVRDTGPGIPPEVLPKIFQPYFTTKGPRQGAGLGLNIVQRLIKEGKGALHVHTQLGEGTTFTIYLLGANLAK